LEKITGDLDSFYWGIVETQIGIGKRYLRPALSRMRRKDLIERYCTDKQYFAGHGMFITGPVGVGKTSILAHLAFSIVRDCGIGFPQGCRDMPELWSTDAAMKLAYRSSSKLFDLLGILGTGPHIDTVRLLEKKPILIIDDLGREFRNQLTTSRFEEFIETRYANQLATIVSTNLAPGQLKQIDGWERIVDRFQESNWMTLLTITGKSMRE
jgi:DNA replication protein DnaC